MGKSYYEATAIKTCYKFKGKKYESKKDLAKAVGVTEVTLRKNIKQGVTKSGDSIRTIKEVTC